MNHCPICGAASVSAYTGLIDLLFGAAGAWGMRRCENQKCGHHWLHPAPSPPELAKAYANYYTHTDQPAGSAWTQLRKLYDDVVGGYLKFHYGYALPRDAGNFSKFWPLLYLSPLRRLRFDHSVMRLRAKPGGRLLDVGCGAGAWLQRMKELGWVSEGVDFDLQAAAVARGRGFQVHCGSLEEAKYPDASFDVVSMHHVLEHLRDPLATLKECLRILKPDGRMVLATPNIGSWGHSMFGPAWRGLEPPRHLNLFSVDSIHRVMEAAGFENVVVQTNTASDIFCYSSALRRCQRAEQKAAMPTTVDKLLGLLMGLVEHFALHFSSSRGECLFVQGKRPV